MAVAVFDVALVQAQATNTAAGTLFNTYSGLVRGNVSNVSMSNAMATKLKYRNGWESSMRISIRKQFYRLQDRQDDQKNLNLSTLVKLQPTFTLNFIGTDSRFFNRIITFSGASQDFRNDRQRFSGNTAYLKTFGSSVIFNGSASGGVDRSEQSFQSEWGMEATGGAELQYKRGTWLSWKGKGFMRNSIKSAKTAADPNTAVGGLGADEDSLRTNIGINLNDSTRVKFAYLRHMRTNEFLDQQRGSLGQVQLNDDVQREVETRSVEKIDIIGELAPLHRLKLTATAGHEDNTTDFLRNKTRFSRNVTDRVSAKLNYTLGRATVVSVELQNRSRLSDFGPQSLGSYAERRKNVRMSISHPITKTLNASLVAGTALLQVFYENFELNPRDRDQLDSFANLRLSSKFFKKLDLSAYLAMNQNKFVSIDASLSNSNRTETTFDLRPEFRYRINDRVEVHQVYSIIIESTEFVFQTDQTQDFLDRTFALRNDINYRMSSRLTTRLQYNLRLHDQGSYLPRESDGVRVLNISQEDRRDEMILGFRYKMTKALALVGENRYAIRQETQTASGFQNSFENGRLELGVEGNYDWGDQRSLKVQLIKVNEFGQFNNPLQESYWRMDSALTYAF